MTSESFQVVEFHSMSTSYSEHSAARAADYDDAASTVLSFDQSPSAEVAEYVSNVAAATNGPVRRPPDVTVSASHDDTDAHISAKECGQDYAMHFFAGLSSDALHQLEISRSQAISEYRALSYAVEPHRFGNGSYHLILVKDLQNVPIPCHTP